MEQTVNYQTRNVVLMIRLTYELLSITRYSLSLSAIQKYDLIFVITTFEKNYYYKLIIFIYYTIFN